LICQGGGAPINWIRWFVIYVAGQGDFQTIWGAMMTALGCEYSHG